MEIFFKVNDFETVCFNLNCLTFFLSWDYSRENSNLLKHGELRMGKKCLCNLSFRLFIRKCGVTVNSGLFQGTVGKSLSLTQRFLC